MAISLQLVLVQLVQSWVAFGCLFCVRWPPYQGTSLKTKGQISASEQTGQQ